jgi:hypothetical protein
MAAVIEAVHANTLPPPRGRTGAPPPRTPVPDRSRPVQQDNGGGHDRSRPGCTAGDPLCTSNI